MAFLKEGGGTEPMNISLIAFKPRLPTRIEPARSLAAVC